MGMGQNTNTRNWTIYQGPFWKEGTDSKADRLIFSEPRLSTAEVVRLVRAMLEGEIHLAGGKRAVSVR